MGKEIKSEKHDEGDSRYGLRKDDELYNTIMLWFERSYNYIKERGLPTQWNRCQKIYENDVWAGLGRSRARHLTKCRIPVAFDAIETGLPVATARMPKPDVKPVIKADSTVYQQYRMLLMNGGNLPNAQQLLPTVDGGVAEVQVDSEQLLKAAEEEFNKYRDKCTGYAQKMQTQLTSDWGESKMPEYNRQAYRANCIYGNAVIKSSWDSQTKKIVNNICDIRTIFPTPGINTIAEHINNPFIYASLMPVSEVMRIYNIDKIDPDAIGEYDQKSGTLNFSSNIKTGWMASIGAAIKTTYTGLFRREGEKDKKLVEGYCQVIECYMPDYSEEEYDDYIYDDNGIKQYDDEGKLKTVNKKRKKFASGHKIVTIIKDNPGWILAEEENRYKDGLPNFFELKNNTQPNDFFGISDITIAEDIIDRINVGASNINDNLRLHGNPIRWEVWNSKVQDQGESTNEIGKVVYVKMPNAMGYLNPPTIGFDIKWWMSDFLFNMLDRVTKTPDAIRGLNSYAEDSGRKIRELRLAATGSFQPKLDAHVQLAKELYQHWAYIHQHFDERILLQKNEDELGESNYVEFIPGELKDLSLNIDVSGETIMPNDPTAEFEQGIALYNLGLARSGKPMISPEQLIDLATLIEDKARAKKYVAQEQERDNLEAKLAEEEQVKAEAAKEYKNAVDAILQNFQKNGNNIVKNPEYDGLLGKLIEITTQFPDFFHSDEYSVLPEVTRIQIATGLAVGAAKNAKKV